ncbi:MAG: InlB B-repeat-containing protein [Bacilli bacterium]|nr:InlB B-repeat-containing protein [Bacilli bacterium]
MNTNDLLNGINNVTIKKYNKVALNVSEVVSSSSTFNRYTIKYTSNVHVKGEITYDAGNGLETERFYLEPATNYTFSSFINGYIDNRAISKSNLKSINFENIEDKDGKFTIISFELVSYPKIADLVNSIDSSPGTGKSIKYHTNVKEHTVFMKSSNITLGLSLFYGGSINYISGNSNIFSSKFANKNIINHADGGRLIQQCYYGNQTYTDGNPYSSTSDEIGGVYNPVQGGNPVINGVVNKSRNSKLVDIGVSSDKKTITIKTQPSLWLISNSAYKNKYKDYYGGNISDSYMLTKYSIHDQYIDVEASYIDFTDNVKNTNHGLARSESPSIYTIGALNKFYYVDISTKKTTQGNLGSLSGGRRQLLDKDNKAAIYSWWGGYFSSSGGVTEGIGLYHPNYPNYTDGADQYMSGFIAGTSNTSDEIAADTSFFTSIIHLNKNRLQPFKKVNYEYIITLGNINNINTIMDKYRTEHSYTLKVDPNGGSFNNTTSISTLSPGLFPYWGNWNNIGAANRNGYKLLGYYDSKTNGTKVYDATGLAVNSKYWRVLKSTLFELEYQYIGKKNLTVYARWEANKYNITYNLNGGVNNSANPTTYTVEDAITLKNPTKKGYTFKGWTGTGLSSASTNVSIAKGSTGNRTYTATWEVANYKVTFNPNGGNVSETTRNIKYGASFGTLPNPTRKGYTFEGWYNDKNEKVLSTTIYNYEKDIELVAHWKLEIYTIEYNLDGGAVNNLSSYNVESKDIILNNPKKDGYLFDGWIGTDIDDKQMQVIIKSGSTGDRIYKATWKSKKYTITYDANGGSVNTTNQKVDYGENIGIMPIPKKDNNYFLGWYTTKDGGEKILSTTNYNYKKDIILYAHWTDKEVYTINYDVNGASDSISSEVREKNTSYAKLPQPEKKGYTFDGWYTKKENGTKITEQDSVTSDVSLYARWNIITYTINYDLDGGKVSNNPDKYTIETDTFKINNPNKDNYTFVGWRNNDDGSILKNISISKGSTGNKSFTALYEVKAASSINDEKEIKEEKDISKNGKISNDKFNYLLLLPLGLIFLIFVIIWIFNKNKDKKDI